MWIFPLVTSLLFTWAVPLSVHWVGLSLLTSVFLCQSFLSESIPTCSAFFSLAVCSSSFCPPGAPHQWLTSVAGQRTVYVYVNDKTRPGINAVLNWRHPKSECCPHPFSAVNTHNNKSILIQICVLLCSCYLSWCLSVVRSRTKGVLYVPLSKTPLATFSLLVLIEVY